MQSVTRSTLLPRLKDKCCVDYWLAGVKSQQSKQKCLAPVRLFLDAQFNTVAEIRPPDGHGFAGHAVLLPDGRHLPFTMRILALSSQVRIQSL